MPAGRCTKNVELSRKIRGKGFKRKGEFTPSQLKIKI